MTKLKRHGTNGNNGIPMKMYSQRVHPAPSDDIPTISGGTIMIERL